MGHTVRDHTGVVAIINSWAGSPTFHLVSLRLSPEGHGIQLSKGLAVE